MTYLIIPNPGLEELRRQLRESEITYAQYRATLRTLPEPPPVLCATGCGREAHSIERGKPLCGMCGLQARSRRR
jgi:hypothetical protein